MKTLQDLYNIVASLKLTCGHAHKCGAFRSSIDVTGVPAHIILEFIQQYAGQFEWFFTENDEMILTAIEAKGGTVFLYSQTLDQNHKETFYVLKEKAESAISA